MDVKCKHCRKILFDRQFVPILTAHSEIRENFTDGTCANDDPETCLFISADNMPEWLSSIVDQESWTKGRIHCPHCNTRIGSFNFVNELKCHCNKFLTPPVRIIHSKVDVLFDNK